MKLHICSDLHLSHYKENISFLDSFRSDGIDICIVAGDIGESDSIEPGLTRLCEMYPNVIYVLGNHEFYSSSRPRVLDLMEKIESKLSNLDFLENENIVIEGVRFAGATLWFPWDPFCAVYAREWSDFRYIKELKNWFQDINKTSRDFFTRNSTDIVITHHAPSYQSVRKEYTGSLYNRFFVCDMEKEIIMNQPKLWIHGHTHSDHDYMIGNTRIVCHPRGYPNEALNRNYQPLLVEI